MKADRAADLVKGILVDVDAALAGEQRDIADRHSAIASAGMLSIRLIGGACINLARIANALNKIAHHLEVISDNMENTDEARKAD